MGFACPRLYKFGRSWLLDTVVSGKRGKICEKYIREVLRLRRVGRIYPAAMGYLGHRMQERERRVADGRRSGQSSMVVIHMETLAGVTTTVSSAVLQFPKALASAHTAYSQVATAQCRRNEKKILM